jgi:hypothetical protein
VRAGKQISATISGSTATVLDMTLRALGVAAILLVFTSSAVAGGVDWSAYIEKPGTARRLPMQKSVPVAGDEPAPAKVTKKKSTAKSKRVARTSKAKAKASRAKAKSRANAKRRR